MTREQIRRAAEVYIKEQTYESLEADDDTFAAFVAGANSRQAEIDELTADIERYKQDIAEGLKREDVARKVIDDKRAEMDNLNELLKHRPAAQVHDDNDGD